MGEAARVLRAIVSMLRSHRLRRYRGRQPEELLAKVTAYYQSDQGASYYSTLSGMDLWQDMVRRKAFQQRCDQAADIVDFGCGAGGLSRALAEHFPDKRIHAIDTGKCAGKLLQDAPSNLTYRTGSVLDATYPAASMDLVISRFVIEHLIQPERMLAEAHRILKPAGCLYLLYPQLMLRAEATAILAEIATWLSGSSAITYLDPEISAQTDRADDHDAVWLTNPVKMARLVRRGGFRVLHNIPPQSLIVAQKPSV